MKWLSKTQIKINHVMYLPAEQSIYVADKRQSERLTEQQALLLQRLCLTPNEPVSREELIELIWGERYETGNKGLNHIIWQLRKLLEASGPLMDDFIERVPKVGYQLNGDVKVTWLYVTPVREPITPVISDEVLVVADKTLELTEQIKKLLIALLAKAPKVEIAYVIAGGMCSRVALLNMLGQLQLKLSEIHPDARLLKSWDNTQLLLGELKSNDVAADDLTVPKSIHHKELDSRKENNNEAIDKITNKKKNLVPFNRHYAIHFITILVLFISLFFNWKQKLVHNNVVNENTQSVISFIDELFTDFHHRFNQEANINITQILNVTDRRLALSIGKQQLTRYQQLRLLLMIAKLNIRYFRFEQGEKQLNQVLHLITHQPITTDYERQVYLGTLNEFIFIKTNSAEYEFATQYIEQAKQPIFDDLPMNHPAIIKREELEIKLNMQLGLFEDAMSQIDTTLKVAATIKDKTVAAKAILPILNTKGVLLWQQSKLEQAAQAFTEANELATLYVDEHHLDTITRYRNLGAIYLFNGNLKLSLHHFGKAINLTESFIGANTHRQPLMFNNYSFALFENGDVEQALTVIDNAIELSYSLFGKDSPQNGYLYLSKATHLFHSKRYQQAKYYNEKALASFSLSGNSKHPFRGRVLILASHLARVAQDIIYCNSYAEMAKQHVTDVYSDVNHWEHLVADITATACQFIEGNKSAIKEGESPEVLVNKQLNQLAEKLGHDSLPVRQIRHKLGDLVTASF